MFTFNVADMNRCPNLIHGLRLYSEYICHDSCLALLLQATLHIYVSDSLRKNCNWIVPTRYSARHDGLVYLDNDFTTVKGTINQRK